MTVDQILQACLTGVVGLLAAAIKFGAGSLNERLKALEKTVGDYAEKLLTLALNEKSLKEKLLALEDRAEDIAQRLHETNKTVTVIKLTQDRCKTCNHL